MEEITKEIKEKIMQKAYQENGLWYINLENSRLDFSWKYKIEKFTKKGVKLSWINGDTKITKLGKVEDQGHCYKLYTEGFNYTLRLMKDDYCRFCEEKIEGYGNNPAPLGDEGDVACDRCNEKLVIPARIEKINVGGYN
jgi:hypothetical protein